MGGAALVTAYETAQENISRKEMCNEAFTEANWINYDNNARTPARANSITPLAAILDSAGCRLSSASTRFVSVCTRSRSSQMVAFCTAFSVSHAAKRCRNSATGSDIAAEPGAGTTVAGDPQLP